jgi:hypothetical protein
VDLDRTPGTRHEVDPANPIVPTIWPFKVEWIEFIAEDKVKEWEELMRKNVRAALPENKAVSPGCETICGCSGGWDDCDCWGNGCDEC